MRKAFREWPLECGMVAGGLIGTPIGLAYGVAIGEPWLIWAFGGALPGVAGGLFVAMLALEIKWAREDAEDVL